MASIKTRVINKHDTEANWNKASGFIPKQGEIIVYDVDSSHTYERIKIGDGVTTVTSLPFSLEHTHTVTTTGSVSSTFKGTAGTATATYKPAGSVTISKGTGTANYTPQGSITINSYTPEGSVSQPTFTGSAHDHKATFTGTKGTASVDYTPAGSVSKPSVTVTPTTTTVNSITGVGSLPSLTTSYNSADQKLTFDWSAGTLPTKGSNTTVMTGASAALASTPTFTGTKATISHEYTPTGTIDVEGTTATGTVSKPTFTGTGKAPTGNFSGSGAELKATFSGTQATINSSYTPAGTVSSTFTGTTVQTSEIIK